MPRYLIRLECPEERFLEWSTIVDAPVTCGMTEGELREYIRQEYGRQGLRRLDERIERCREKGTSAYNVDREAAIAFNRAGPDETHATLEEIKESYCREPTDDGRPEDG